MIIKRLEARSPSDTGWVLSGVVALGFASLVAFVLSAISLAYSLTFSIDSLADEIGAAEGTGDRAKLAVLEAAMPTIVTPAIVLVVCLVLVMRGRDGWRGAKESRVVTRAAILVVPAFVATVVLSGAAAYVIGFY